MGGRTGRKPPRRGQVPQRGRARPDAAGLSEIGATTIAGQGLSRSNWDDAQIEILTAPFTEHELEITEEGHVYAPQIHLRQRLSKAFRAGNWGLALGKPEVVDDVPVIRVRLYVHGVAVAEAYAERGNGLEAAKSQGLGRCCKDIDMAAQCWDVRWSHHFRMKHGVLVDDDGHARWRNLLSPPLPDECGIDPRSPNKRRYRKPTTVELVSGLVRSPRRAADKEKSDALRRQTDLGGGGDTKRIPSQSLKALMVAARQHRRSAADVKRYIKEKWGHTSRRDIRVGQFDDLIDWVRAPKAKR